MTFFGLPFDYWTIYVFGNVLFTGVFFILLFTIFGLSKGWSVDVFAVLYVPLATFLFIGGVLPATLESVALVFCGVVIGLAVIKMFNR
ncbi:hypothetical protein GQ473_03200 [archaeon]|nr:hypothetical protein [archaeon]